MENEERRRRKNNMVIMVITECRGEGKSKQQIKEDIEKFIKINIEEAKVKNCYNINKDQVLVEVEEWSGKEKVMKQKGKPGGKKETEKIFIDNNLTKQEREIQKKLRAIAKKEKREEKEVKVGYMKITIEGVQRKGNEERGRLQVFHQREEDGMEKTETTEMDKGQRKR
ncbi:hypothetical protein MTP99_008274 [Tenebrio molitor]|nr:hypothetical protein MTP99_008274 [Tenebrio molitor]